MKLFFGIKPPKDLYDQGLLDHYTLHVLNDDNLVKSESKLKQLKVKDLRAQLALCLSTQMYNLIDVDEFVTREIETKGIVVIDEIDKLA